MNDALAPPFWLNTLLGGVTALAALVWLRVATRWSNSQQAVESETRAPVPWGVDGAALAGLSMALAWSSAWLAKDKEPSTEPLALSDATAFAAMAAALSVMAIAWQRTNVCAKPSDFGLPRSLRQLLKDSLLGVATCAAMLPLVYGVQMLIVFGLGLRSSHPTVETLLANPTLEVVAAAALMAVVVAPLFEELAFRVLLQGWLERLGGPDAWWPVVGAAAAFALSHAGQGYAPAPLFVFSLGLGYVYRQTHRLAPSVIAHMAFNALSLTMAVGMAPAPVAP